IRVFNFEKPPRDFVPELLRLVGLVSKRGLIIDVRGNPGGYINAGEQSLQLFTPSQIDPEPAEFINTDLNLAICHRADFKAWIESISQAVETGSVYSQGFPLTSAEACNNIGQRYYGPVVLIVDALCYSTTDIFSAGFKDHRIGMIIGTSKNTGAGGANVWTHSDILDLMQSAPPDFGFAALPGGSDRRLAFGRTIRVGKMAGTVLEELGVRRDSPYEMSKEDVLNGTVDLIKHAASILSPRRSHAFEVKTSRYN